VKLFRTIQLDTSDTFVFERSAEAGERAVSGAFAFAGTDIASLRGKARSAFRVGFLGLESLGRSTLVQIVGANEADRDAVVVKLTGQLVAHSCEPDLRAARRAAEEEVEFTNSLCVHPVSTVVAVTRNYEDGAIRETFSALLPRDGSRHAPAFEFIEVVGDDDDVAGLERGAGK
jgi:hypothetical protein